MGKEMCRKLAQEIKEEAERPPMIYTTDSHGETTVGVELAVDEDGQVYLPVGDKKIPREQTVGPDGRPYGCLFVTHKGVTRTHRAWVGDTLTRPGSGATTVFLVVDRGEFSPTDTVGWGEIPGLHRGHVAVRSGQHLVVRLDAGYGVRLPLANGRCLDMCNEGEGGALRILECTEEERDALLTLLTERREERRRNRRRKTNAAGGKSAGAGDQPRRRRRSGGHFPPTSAAQHQDATA